MPGARRLYPPGYFPPAFAETLSRRNSKGVTMDFIDARWRIGVDSGGTFTDVCVIDEKSGKTQVWKLSSTPTDPSLAIAGSVTHALANNGIPAQAVSYFGHGTTVGTNALLERRGTRIALLTSEGFADLIEIGRQQRPHLYDMDADKTVPLADRADRFPVRERILHDGRVETAVDPDEVRALAARLRDGGYEAIAVCFLYGFAYPQHEELVRDILLEAMPDAFISLSSDVAPEFREYERTSTTVANAYLGPVMGRYLTALERRLRDQNLRPRPQLTQSNGGVISFASAASHPIKTILSGPAAGIVAAGAIARDAGYHNIITFDMGGTSTDLALMTDGRCQISTGLVVEGYPLKVPALDIHTVGAGGGSFAYIDEGGLLKVGPRSAGAHPGPACYGNGTTEATVTDANVVLQLLNPKELLRGRMPIDRDRSVAAVGAIAKRLSLTVEQAARGIISVAIANMARSTRVISVQRGHDPRDYVMMAFGGAGPLHAAWLAQELDIAKVIVPTFPGALCAQGLLLADLRTDITAALMQRLDGGGEAIAAAIASLKRRGDEWFDIETVEPARRSFRVSADMRYVGQNFELAIDVPDDVSGGELVESLQKRFAARHFREYGFIDDRKPIEIVTMRLEAIGAIETPAPRQQPLGSPDPAADAVISRRSANFSGNGWLGCPVYDRDRLVAGNIVIGPAIIEQMDTTTVVPPDMRASVDPSGNIIIEIRP